MTRTADFIIVGSGPSGVSAAWPLVRAGASVVMVDQGNEGPTERPVTRSLLDIRSKDPDQWRIFVGEDFVGALSPDDKLPRYRVPAFREVFEGFHDAYHVSCDGFTLTGTLSRGGLSGVWGAGCYTLAPHELNTFPAPMGDLERSYRSVARRVGINGVPNDDIGGLEVEHIPLQPPLPLHRNTERLIRNYEALRANTRKQRWIRIGRTRNAVLSEPLGERRACDLTNMCFWGCASRSIYNSSYELPALERFQNFQYVDHAFVDRISKRGDIYALQCIDIRNPHARRQYLGRRVILAAGTVGSTALALSYLGVLDQPVPLIHNPFFAMAFLMPGQIGFPPSAKGFALAHLAYYLEEESDPDDFAFGTIGTPEGLLGSELVFQLPLTRRRSIEVAKYLATALVIANGYLHGKYTRSTMKVTRESALNQIHIYGAYRPDMEQKVTEVKKRLGRSLVRLGAYPLPKGNILPDRGLDGHYAGTLPMTKDRRPLTTSPDGELRGASNIFIVDGSVIPSLSAKPPTFTIMANADRIASRLAANH